MFNSLDHVAIVGKDLDDLSHRYERLGFNLTESSRHQTRDPVSGELKTAGTANRCAMFEHGYLELLAAVDETLDCRGIPELVEKYEGIHIVAFGVNEPQIETRRLEREGFSPYLNELSRTVFTDGERQTARFEQLRIDSSVSMEARMFGIRHLTPDLLWRDEYMRHPNTAVALAAVEVVVDDVTEAVSRYRRFLGAGERHANGGAMFGLDRGSLEVIDDKASASRYPCPDSCRHGRFMGYTITVANLPACRSVLDAGDVPYHHDHDAIVVEPIHAAGAYCRFEACRQ